MNPRTMVVLVLALVCGTSAAIGVSLLGGGKKSRPEPVETVDVLVAAMEVPRGTPLVEEMIKKQEWPANLLPTGAITDMDDAIDRVALSTITPDEPILKSKIAKTGYGASSLVKPGWRAYTIHTPTVSSGVAGFVMPGNHVDVLMTVVNRAADNTGGGVTSTLLQNVEILAADQRLAQDDKSTDAASSLQSVTLLVTPEMAAKLSLAQTVGSLQLSLRNDGDTQIADANPVTVNQLEFDQEAVSSDEGDGPDKVADEDAATVKPVNARPDYLMIRTYRGAGSGMIHVSN